MRLATLSFDDGVGCDGRIIALLNTLCIPATFYVCAGFLDRMHTRMKPEDIPGRYRGHEIGNHSWSHHDFRETHPDTWRHEIGDSRERLAQFFQADVECFAYPYGAQFPALHQAVSAAGHRWARTILRRPHQVLNQANPMAMTVTEWLVPPFQSDLVRLDLLRSEPVLNLSGHAHEIVENGLVPAFVDLLEALKAAGFEFMTNSQFWKRTWKCNR